MTKMYPMMTRDQFLSLKRGSEIIYNGVRSRCVWSYENKSGGVGMGEFPTENFAVFENGMVLVSDEWSAKVAIKFPPFREVSPDF